MAAGKEVHEAKNIAPTLGRAREAIAKTGTSEVIKVWDDPKEYAPGSKNQLCASDARRRAAEVSALPCGSEAQGDTQ